jgi:Flp pilus assembly pilin Flp
MGATGRRTTTVPRSSSHLKGTNHDRLRSSDAPATGDARKGISSLEYGVLAVAIITALATASKTFSTGFGTLFNQAVTDITNAVSQRRPSPCASLARASGRRSRCRGPVGHCPATA